MTDYATTSLSAQEIIDDDDWIDIDRALPGSAERPDVEVRLSIFKMRGKLLKARAYIVFRREASKWIDANRPRFRVSIGGNKANFIRIVPDPQAGKFENMTFHGVERLLVGHIPAWPNEVRESTAAKWTIDRGWMKLELPGDFATPRLKSSQGALVAMPAAASKMPAVGDARAFQGDPPPGRSALDQRRTGAT